MIFRHSLLLFRALFFLICATIPAIPTIGHAADNNGITVLELFTTQGCSSCPPADRLFEKLARQENGNTIILACHVTYFDSEIWKDTLSIPACDARQKEYFSSLDLGKLFTPQAIINGRFDVVGSSEPLVTKGLRMGKSLNTIKPVQLSLREGYLDISLPRLGLERPADIWLFSYGAAKQEVISAGQNKGEVINYTNPVKRVTKLMQWDGRYINMAFPVDDTQGNGYAVIAQYSDHTDIVAAGHVKPPYSPGP